MKFIKPSYEILSQNPGIEGIYEAIERAGRVCYKSTRKEGTTAKDFVDKMIKSGHLGVLENGTVYLKIRKGTYAYNHYVVICEPDDDFMSSSYELPIRPYTKVNIQDDYIYVTTNYRVLYENGWLDDLHYLCEPTEYHPKRISVRFISNIHFYKDITRHRKAGFCIESSRYCNYSKDRFGRELTFIHPEWIDDKYITRYKENPGFIEEFLYDYSEEEKGIHNFCRFVNCLKCQEETYMDLIDNGWKTEQAADVLPQDTKAEIICTAFLDDWEHIWDQRCSFKAVTGKPYSEVSRLMDPLYREIHES